MKKIFRIEITCTSCQDEEIMLIREIEAKDFFKEDIISALRKVLKESFCKEHNNSLRIVCKTLRE